MEIPSQPARLNEVPHCTPHTPIGPHPVAFLSSTVMFETYACTRCWMRVHSGLHSGLEGQTDGARPKGGTQLHTEG